jgi:hypothetical protein
MCTLIRDGVTFNEQILWWALFAQLLEEIIAQIFLKNNNHAKQDLEKSKQGAHTYLEVLDQEKGDFLWNKVQHCEPYNVEVGTEKRLLNI